MVENIKQFLKKTLFKEDFEKLEQLKQQYKKQPATKKQTKHIQKLAAKKINNSKKKLDEVINSLYANEYLKEDGSYNIYKIAKDTGMSRNTVMKYLKNYE